MKKKVLIIDTSILMVWLNVPGFETAGKGNEWTIDNVTEKLQKEQDNGTCFILPIATIIEAGNHIAQVKKGDEICKSLVNRFADLLENVAKNETPWTLFKNQAELWSPEQLIELAEQWRKTGIMKLSLGDASIVKIAQYYQPTYEVEIFTGDRQLKGYEKLPQEFIIPRRRKG